MVASAMALHNVDKGVGMMRKFRFFLIKLLAGHDIAVAINCVIDGDLYINQGPCWVTQCIFVGDKHLEEAKPESDRSIADLLYSAYAKLSVAQG